MEIKPEHITLKKFLEFFKPQFDTTPNQKIVLPNSDFVLIAAILKLVNVEQVRGRK